MFAGSANEAAFILRIALSLRAFTVISPTDAKVSAIRSSNGFVVALWQSRTRSCSPLTSKGVSDGPHEWTERDHARDCACRVEHA
jgi:hypothetical protein